MQLPLKKALEDRIADLGKPGSWPAILADLDSLTETEVEQDDKRFMLRSGWVRPRECIICVVKDHAIGGHIV